MRLIDEDGKQLGIFDLSQALAKAKEKGLDLIQVTEKAQPPVCKISDFGKYIYQVRKKEKHQTSKNAGGLKNIRLTFNISDHDLETRAKAADNFLKKGYKIRVELPLRGRENRLADFAKEKIKKFLEILKESVLVKIDKELKRESRGFIIIVSKQ